ncbi:hypothetical protein ACFE04_028459 [Oxalis oulophora]
MENTFYPLCPESFTSESKQIIDLIAQYYRKIESYPVESQVEPGYLSQKLPAKAPCYPEPLKDIIKDIEDHIFPGLTHWLSPNFFGYFPTTTSTASFLGEMLCSAFNVVGFTWNASPAATELESLVMDWLAQMLKLPNSFMFSGTGGGVLQGSTCEALVCCLAAARDRAIKENGHEFITKLVVYTSDQTHFAVQKSAKIVGILPCNFRSLPTSISTEFSLSPSILREAIEEDKRADSDIVGLVPLFLCATLGTTTSCAIDPIEELGEIANDYKLWFHIDAAYAGSACICPEFRHYLNGVKLADSISINAHKWLLTNLDCCCLWVKQPSALTDSLAIEAEILNNNIVVESNSVVDYKDWQISLSRRFRAMKLWLVIRRYGCANLMLHIRSDVSMAERFEAMVAKDKRFEIVVPRRFALVCFRLKPKQESQGTELNKKLMNVVNSSGEAFMTHAMLGGIYVIRCAIGATLTKEHHVDNLWELIKEKADYLLQEVS